MTVVRFKRRGGPPTTPEGYARWAHDVVVELRADLLVPEDISNLDAGILFGAMNMASGRRLEPGISDEERALWRRVSKACAAALSGPDRG